MMGALITTLLLTTFFLWAVLGHSTEAERQQVVDSSCAVKVKQVRYPDGMRTPVCNPTGVAWRN